MTFSKGLTLTVSEVESLLHTPKSTVAPMLWNKQAHRNTLEYTTPLVDTELDEQMESLILRATYPVLPAELPAHFSFSLFFNNQRIYAIDKVLPGKGHRNNKGKGRPFYQQTIFGSHVHSWSGDGYGYAEPLPSQLSGATHEECWQYFAGKTKIELNGNYRHPLDEDSGQIQLL